MNLGIGLRTGLAGLAFATAPITGNAQKIAQTIIRDSVKIEQKVVKKGNKWVSISKRTNKYTGAFLGECRVSSTQKPANYITPIEKEGVFRVGVDYGSRDILGLRTKEPRMKAQFDGRYEKVYFRPEVAVGNQSYNAVIPLGVQFNVGKGGAVELGSDLGGVRGFLNGNKVFFEQDVQKVLNGKDCKAHAYSGEFFQNIRAGGRYKNEIVNASVRGEVGRTAYISNWSIKETPGSDLNAIQSSGIPVLKKQPSVYAGARANVEVTPFKNNRNIAINAEGAVTTNKSPEGAVGVAYKF